MALTVLLLVQQIEEKLRHCVDRRVSLEKRRHKGVQGLVFQVQRLKAFRTLNIEL
jgi:hypothetical protein